MSDHPFSIFVVEDNEWYNKLLVHTLSLNPDFEVTSFFNGQDLIKALSQKKPNVISVDYRLPDMTGDQLIKKIKEIEESIEIIVVSEQGEIETAVELLKAGAYDYLVKGEDLRDRLLNTVNNIRKSSGLKKRIVSLEKEVERKYNFENTMIGNSAAMKKVYGIIEKALNTDITVSISGETGTGKEVVAKAIHYNSARKKEPFIAVNMAAIPSELIESELFGHEKGAFTGAATRRKGKFEEASGGTLFLDEIGEMDINFQAKLLRVLQEKEVTRVGSNTPVKIDCRIIIATNRDLAEEVEKGNFREDLFYRLFGLPIKLPPLREREKDVLLLATYFIREFCKNNNLAEKSLSEEARQKLLSYKWPGNVREVKSIIELAIVMASGKEIEGSDITLNSADALPDVMGKEMTLREYNYRIVTLYLEQYNHDTKLVANKLGIGQTTVYRLLKEFS